MASVTLISKLVGDAKGMVDEFNRAGRAASDLDQSQGRLGSGLASLKGNYLMAAGAVGAATAATAGAVAMVKSMVGAAAEDEASQAMLQKAVENTGIAYSTVSADIEALIKRGQELAFTDDQTRAGLSMLEAQTSSHAEAVKRLGMAQDLARGTGMELEVASRLLGKVTEENINVLNRYGISVGKGASETELFAAVQKKFGGQATTYADTSVASFDRLKDRIAEAQEAIGYKLMPLVARGAEDAVKAIDGIGSALQRVVNSGPYRIAVEFTGGVFGEGDTKGDSFWQQIARGVGQQVKSEFNMATGGPLRAAFDFLKFQPPMTDAEQMQARFGGLSEAETGGGGTFRTQAERVRDENAALGALHDKYQEYFNDLRGTGMSVAEATKRTAEYAEAGGKASKAAIDGIRTSTTMEETFQQLRRTTSVLTEATEAAARAEDALGDVRKKMAGERLNAEIEAYLEGGEKKLAVVRDEQMLQQAAIEMTAARLQKVFGLDVPASLEYAFTHVTNAAAAMSEKIKADFAAVDALRFGAVSSPGADILRDYEEGAKQGKVLANDGKGNQSWFPAGQVPAGYNTIVDPRMLGYQGPTLLGPATGGYSPAPNVTVNIQSLDGQTAADATVRALSQLEREGRIGNVTVVG